MLAKGMDMASTVTEGNMLAKGMEMASTVTEGDMLTEGLDLASTVGRGNVLTKSLVNLSSSVAEIKMLRKEMTNSLAESLDLAKAKTTADVSMLKVTEETLRFPTEMVHDSVWLNRLKYDEAETSSVERLENTRFERTDYDSETTDTDEESSKKMSPQKTWSLLMGDDQE